MFPLLLVDLSVNEIRPTREVVDAFNMNLGEWIMRRSRTNQLAFGTDPQISFPLFQFQHGELDRFQALNRIIKKVVDDRS